MRDIDLVLTVIGALVLFLGLVSRALRRWGLPDPLVALGIGVLLGPAVTGLLDARAWGEQERILTEVSRIALAVGLMGIALSLPKSYPRRNWRPVLLILLVVTPFMWMASSVLVFMLLPLPLLTAVLIGAVITPTDPIAAAAIVTGDVARRHLPDRLRYLISAEAGANDGLAHLFVLLPILLLSRPLGEALVSWATRTLIWEVGGAAVLGVIAGLGAGRLLKWSEARNYIEKPAFLAYSLALALLTVGAAQLLRTEGMVAVFVAGVAFDFVVTASERVEEERVVEGVDRFFTLPSFSLLGVLAPWGEWAALGPPAALLVLGVLFLRRLPIVVLIRPVAAPLESRADALFVGWFGPLGVAAVFYANYAVLESGLHEVWVVTSLMVCASVVVHGLSAAPLTRVFGRLAAQPASRSSEAR